MISCGAHGKRPWWLVCIHITDHDAPVHAVSRDYDGSGGCVGDALCEICDRMKQGQDQLGFVPDDFWTELLRVVCAPCAEDLGMEL